MEMLSMPVPTTFPPSHLYVAMSAVVMEGKVRVLEVSDSAVLESIWVHV